jgi:hypothetical protein
MQGLEKGQGRASRENGRAALGDRDGRADFAVGDSGRFHPVRLTLLGVAVFHHHTLQVALTGSPAIVATSSPSRASIRALASRPRAAHGTRVGDPGHLFLLLMGFALLSRHFEEEQAARRHAAFLPDD